MHDPASGEPRTSNVGDFLRTFRELNSLSSGRVGYAAVECTDGSRWNDACRRAALQGEALRDELLDIVIRTGTPLGRLTAAALLARFDRAAGRDAFNQLTRSDGSVYNAVGCCVMTYRVADIAKQILASGVLTIDPAPVVLQYALDDIVRCRVQNLVGERVSAWEGGSSPA